MYRNGVWYLSPRTNLWLPSQLRKQLKIAEDLGEDNQTEVARESGTWQVVDVLLLLMNILQDLEDLMQTRRGHEGQAR